MKKYIGEILISVIIWILGVEIAQQYVGAIPIVILVVDAICFFLGVSFFIKGTETDSDKESNEPVESNELLNSPSNTE